MNEEQPSHPAEAPLVEELMPPATPILRPGASQTTDPSAITRGDVASEGLQAKQEFLWRTHAYINEYIRFSDAKAGFVVAVSGALLGMLISSKCHELFIRPLGGVITGLGWLSVVAFFFLTASGIAALISVWPRLRSFQSKAFIYFGGIAEHASQEVFYSSFRTLTEESLVEHVAHHVHTLAFICQRKYLWVSVSIIAVSLGGFFASLLLLLKPATQ